jgi:HNH endonuclease.
MRFGSENPNWKGGERILACMVCRSEFQVRPCRAAKAKCCSLKCWNDFQKASNSTKGIRKKEWVEKVCRWCSQTFELPPARARVVHFCSRKCQFTWRSERHSGERNPNWNGGTRSEEYPASFYDIRRKILHRDGFTCAVPMCRSTSSKVCVHHIDYDKKNCVETNLISACPSCNSRANFSRLLWKGLLSSFLRWRIANGIMNIGWRGTVEINSA